MIMQRSISDVFNATGTWASATTGICFDFANEILLFKMASVHFVPSLDHGIHGGQILV